MSTPFLGQITLFSFGYAPRGWAQCNGQLLPINQNQALFALLGTTYGGNGQTNFALPDMRGRAPFHVGSNFPQGAAGGEENHALSITELPTHAHAVTAANDAAAVASPANAYWASASKVLYTNYDAASAVAMLPSALANSGGNTPHPNMPPFLTLNFCIALVGIFPSRN